MSLQVEISFDEIPSYLMRTKLYDEISKYKSRNNNFIVPEFEKVPDFSNKQKARRMFASLNEWGAYEIPQEFLDACKSNIKGILPCLDNKTDIFEIAILTLASYIDKSNFDDFVYFVDENTDIESFSKPLVNSILTSNPSIRNHLADNNIIQRKIAFSFDVALKTLLILYGLYIDVNNGINDRFSIVKEKLNLKTDEPQMIGSELGVLISLCNPTMVVSFDYESNMASDPQYTNDFQPMIVHIVRCMLKSGRYIGDSFHREESIWLRKTMLKSTINILDELLPDSKMKSINEDDVDHLRVAGMILSAYMTESMSHQLEVTYGWSNLNGIYWEDDGCTPIQYVKYCFAEQLTKNS